MTLTVEALGCARSGRAILRDVGFALEPGAALLLRGPNGAGKSTLLRALAGLLPLTAGSARLDGIGLAADPDAWCERVAYAGHLDAVKPQLGVGENLAFWAALLDAPAGAVGAALDAMGLGALADRPAWTCSAGQKRRLGLARLLLAPRRLWLLDEPTVSLDAEAVAGFAERIRAHCAAGGVAVVATHVDLGLPDADVLDLVPLAPARIGDASDDPFLAGPMT